MGRGRDEQVLLESPDGASGRPAFKPRDATNWNCWLLARARDFAFALRRTPRAACLPSYESTEYHNLY